MSDEAVIEAKDLRKRYGEGNGVRAALDGEAEQICSGCDI